VFPSGPSLWLVLTIGGVFFFADFCYIGAYTIAHGNAVAVTTIFTMLPVFVSIVKFVWTGDAPNRYHTGGYLCALLATILVAKGQATPQ
jgi:drug/metabolite transporter (DMT)-like permease